MCFEKNPLCCEMLKRPPINPLMFVGLGTNIIYTDVYTVL